MVICDIRLPFPWGHVFWLALQSIVAAALIALVVHALVLGVAALLG